MKFPQAELAPFTLLRNTILRLLFKMIHYTSEH